VSTSPARLRPSLPILSCRCKAPCSWSASWRTGPDPCCEQHSRLSAPWLKPRSPALLADRLGRLLLAGLPPVQPPLVHPPASGRTPGRYHIRLSDDASPATSNATAAWSPPATRMPPCCRALQGHRFPGPDHRRLQPRRGIETLYGRPRVARKRVWNAWPCSPGQADEVRRLIAKAKDWPSSWARPSSCGCRDKQDAFVKGIAAEFPDVAHRYLPETTSCATWPSRCWRKTVTPRSRMRRGSAACATSRGRSWRTAARPRAEPEGANAAAASERRGRRGGP